MTFTIPPPYFWAGAGALGMLALLLALGWLMNRSKH